MINQTPEQLQEYRARMKFQMDEIARLDYARLEGEQKGRQEGLQEGLQEGEVIGRIVTLQELLSISQPTREELATYNLSHLADLAKRLKQQLSQRG